MELLYAGVYDPSLRLLAEVVRSSEGKAAALEQVATYTQQRAETRKAGGLHFTFGVSADAAAIVCLASRGHSVKVAAQLLEAVSRIGASASTLAGKAQLASVVDRYVGDTLLLRSDKLDDLGGHLQRLKDAAVSNVEEMLERGDKIDVLVSRSDNLATNTTVFKRSAKQLERTYRCRNYKGWICFALLLVKIVVVYAVFIRKH